MVIDALCLRSGSEYLWVTVQSTDGQDWHERMRLQTVDLEGA